MLRRTDFPEVGELVVCSVQNVKNFGAFVTLDEFSGREGFIHVRDVATGWVKYIRDHVREGQKIVCRVLGVDSDKGHIDLSLKQVNDHQRREKVQEWKNEKKADKLLEMAATKLGKTHEQAYEEVGDKLIEEFGSLYGALEETASDPSVLKNLGIDKKWVAAMTSLANESIQLPSVSIDGVLEITSPAPDGIDMIRTSLGGAIAGAEDDVSIHYLGAPRYKVTVTAEDYKTAEEELKKVIDKAVSSIEKTGGTASFKRKEEK
ncbi:MAG: translation initiation factor IF-2 subunit alpha [Methanobacteriota archaeon]|nr:MAG: translation initiation factor IF-2 subunit alpha [Euryarchaeota archaeon]